MKRITITIQIIINIVLSYYTVMIIAGSILFMINRPNGFYYEVPTTEASFNMALGLFTLFFYILILLSNNIILYKKLNMSVKKYVLLTICIFIFGIVVFVVTHNQRPLI